MTLFEFHERMADRQVILRTTVGDRWRGRIVGWHSNLVTEIEFDRDEKGIVWVNPRHVVSIVEVDADA